MYEGMQEGGPQDKRGSVQEEMRPQGQTLEGTQEQGTQEGPNAV